MVLSLAKSHHVGYWLLLAFLYTYLSINFNLFFIILLLYTAFGKRLHVKSLNLTCQTISGKTGLLALLVG